MKKVNTIKTAINKLPAATKYVNMFLSKSENRKILNYGAGPYYKNVDNCLGVQCWKYDPNYESSNEEEKMYNELSMLPMKFGMIMCSNVLNVIEAWTDVTEAVYQCHRRLEDDGVAVFSIYEGNKSGVGKDTIRGYQRNEVAKEYEDMLATFFPSVKRKGNIFICEKVKCD